MCGIFCSLSRQTFIAPGPNITQLLINRGPDSTGHRQTLIETCSSSRVHATFVSTVLALRGAALVAQPLVDATTGTVLCWNGEAWRIAGLPVAGNDAELVFAKLVEACAVPAADADAAIVGLLSSIQGPYAFVFYNAPHQRLYFGRDCLGRRSLLRSTSPDGALILSSVCDPTSGGTWSEVEADGIYVVKLHVVNDAQVAMNAQHIPHRRAEPSPAHQLSVTLPFPMMNKRTPIQEPGWSTEVVHQLGGSLQESLALRVQQVRDAIPSGLNQSQSDAQVAILFSGGLDCTIIARICHDLLPLTHTIDLLNVAFENPRIHAKLEAGISPYELCPDRITGRSSHLELMTVCPGRVWRFVQIDVPYAETQSHRSTVMSLMHPHNTEMDLSISLALYFASQGRGVSYLSPKQALQPYSSTAHVLLSGLGADELFGGYQRHATSFARCSYQGLVEELELDFDRLGKRNLGRDDRIISNSGKEVRFPYLDEEFIALALQLPVTAKCDFGSLQVVDSQDPTQLLEPAKRALRLLAWQLGMKKVATEKKRAIQFGARTAKMDTGKTKGTNLLT